MAYEAVKKNMMQMLREGATQAELDLYVSSQGLKPEDLKESKHTLERAGWQTLGGAVGGAVATPSVVGTPVGIGLGSAIGGQAYDLKQEFLGRKNRETLVERSVSAAEDFALDVISPLAISKGVYGVKSVAAAVGSKAKGIFKPAEYGVYKKFGVNPSAAMATQSKGLAVAEHALSDFPISSDIFQKHAQKNIENLTFANRFLAKEYGDILSKEEIGMLLKKAAPGVLDRYSDVYNKLFSAVAKDIGPSPVGITNTAKTLNTLIRETSTGPNSGIKSIAAEIIEKSKKVSNLQQSITGTIPPPGLPWESIKKFRTKVGDLMRSPELVTTRNIQSGDLKRLYAALTQDMESAAMASGEKVHARWRAANKYFETKLTRDIPVLEEIIKKKYPEEVFDSVLMKSSQKGGTRLRLLRKQLSQKEWDTVVGTVLGKMGEQKPGFQTTMESVFSPKTFMTNWAKLSKSAKRSLFRGGRYDGLASELNDFVKVAGDAKAVEQLANNSRTGSVLMFFGLWQSGSSALGAGVGGAAAGLPGAVTGAASFAATSVAVPRMTAKLLTNQKFVRWLNEGVKIAKANPAAMSTHLGRLMVLRFREDIQEDVDNVIKGFLEK